MLELTGQDISTCPFCKKVETAAATMGLVAGSDFELIDAASGTPGRDVVLKVGGKGMVPFLIGDGIKIAAAIPVVRLVRPLICPPDKARMEMPPHPNKTIPHEHH